MYKELIISTTNRQIADELLALKIPDATQNEFDKFGEIETAKIIYIAVAFLSTVSAKILATWICNHLFKPGKNDIRINDRTPQNNVIYIENMIINIIQDNKPHESTDKEKNEDK